MAEQWRDASPTPSFVRSSVNRELVLLYWGFGRRSSTGSPSISGAPSQKWLALLKVRFVGSLINGGLPMATWVRVPLLDHFGALFDPLQHAAPRRDWQRFKIRRQQSP
jgi:hypothetical protein